MKPKQQMSKPVGDWRHELALLLRSLRRLVEDVHLHYKQELEKKAR